jgi:hypothetical protein
MAYFWNTLHQFNNYEQITFAMKTAIKTNVTHRYNGTKDFLFDTNYLNTRLSTKNGVYKYVKTKLVFLTLRLIDLLYIIYK